jgi:heterotetrameric sarcosine oxidase gamma subunit
MNETITLTELHEFTLLHVATRRNPSAIAQALSTKLGIDVPVQSNAIVQVHAGLRMLWFGPGRWLIHTATPDWSFTNIPGCAATNLSDSKRIFRLGGNRAIHWLERACPLDLAEPSMPIGTSALTQLDRFPVLLYRKALNDFVLYVDRSYGDSVPGVLS